MSSASQLWSLLTLPSRSLQRMLYSGRCPLPRAAEHVRDFSMLRLLIASLLLAVLSARASEMPKLDIYSVENNTCDRWTEISADPAAVKAQYFWFIGFVSGNNFALPNSQVAAKMMIDEKGFVDLVNSRCKASSKYTITLVAMEFIEYNSPSTNAKQSKKQP